MICEQNKSIDGNIYRPSIFIPKNFFNAEVNPVLMTLLKI